MSIFASSNLEHKTMFYENFIAGPNGYSQTCKAKWSRLNVNCGNESISVTECIVDTHCMQIYLITIIYNQLRETK